MSSTECVPYRYLSFEIMGIKQDKSQNNLSIRKPRQRTSNSSRVEFWVSPLIRSLVTFALLLWSCLHDWWINTEPTNFCDKFNFKMEIGPNCVEFGICLNTRAFVKSESVGRWWMWSFCLTLLLFRCGREVTVSQVWIR